MYPSGTANQDTAGGQTRLGSHVRYHRRVPSPCHHRCHGNATGEQLRGGTVQMGTLIDIRSREWPAHSLDSDPPSQSLTNSNTKKSAKWKSTNWLEWRSYLQGSVFLRFPFESGGGWSGSRGGEGGAAPWRSGRVGSGGKKNGRKKKRRLSGRIYIRLSRTTAYGATQSRQSM